MAVELRPSDREDPFGDLAGLSLFPHTLALASPVPEPQEQESLQNLFDSMVAKGSKKILEDACTISASYSKNQHLYVEAEDKDRITDLKGNKENPQGRRPALGRKRARFSLKPISRDSSANSGIYDIVEPQEYFTAVDQMQKAEEELKKCQSGADLVQHHPSPTVRNRRHGILGRTAGYKHHISDNADATVTLKMLQEDIPGQGIPSPAKVSAYTELHLETTEKGVSPSMGAKSELFGDTGGQGIVTEKGSIDDVLEKLFSSFKDINGDNGVKLLQEKLRAKSRNLGKMTLSEPDGIQRSNPRILKSTTRKGLDGSQLPEQTSAITTRSPLAVIANLQRRISLKDPPSDPYAMPLSDDESYLAETMGQKIPLSSSADMNHDVANDIPAEDAFTPEIVSGKRTSFVEKIHLSVHDANQTINKKMTSEEDNVEHPPYMCTNSVDFCGFSNLENNVAAGHDGPSAKESDTVVKDLTSEFVNQNDIEVLVSPPSMNTSSNISKRINASASSFGGDVTLQDEVNVTLEGETVSHAKDSKESSRRRSSRKIGQNINNSGNGGTSSSRRNTVLQDEVNVMVQGEAGSSAEVSSGSLVGDARNLSTNPEEDASPPGEFLPENRPSTIVPEENNETHILQETSGVSPVRVRKRKASLNAQSKKKSTSNKQSNSRRQSLADAGFTWRSGVRRSTRIKTRPLQHWCGEKVLYGRVHNSLITVIGMRYAEKEVDGKSPVLKVKSYVSDKYADLVSKVAK